ncbi:MAG: hypothetical protein HY924_16060 [Elusimicrobia bacterium]|nr:hypothetical protein [Elusimicrobiota bacterium]
MNTGRLAWTLVLAAAAGPCWGQVPPPPAPKAAAVAEVKASTPAATLAELYPVEKMRDPFMKGSSGGSVDAESCKPEDFSIHLLVLKAMLKDPRVDFALLSDPCGASYVFSGGKLYRDAVAKKNVVSGVSGTMTMAQKTLTLQTAEKDVQVLRLGEEEEKEKESP